MSPRQYSADPDPEPPPPLTKEWGESLAGGDARHLVRIYVRAAVNKVRSADGVVITEKDLRQWPLAGLEALEELRVAVEHETDHWILLGLDRRNTKSEIARRIGVRRQALDNRIRSRHLFDL